MVWGHESVAGEAEISGDLTGVMFAMCSTACIVEKSDQTALVWGDPEYGGDASTVELTNIKTAMCGREACVAVKGITF